LLFLLSLSLSQWVMLFSCSLRLTSNQIKRVVIMPTEKTTYLFQDLNSLNGTFLICPPSIVVISLLLLLLPVVVVVTSLVIFCKSSMFILLLFLLVSEPNLSSSKGDTGTGCSYILWRSTSEWLMKALPHLSHLSIANLFFFLPLFLLSLFLYHSPQGSSLYCHSFLHLLLVSSHSDYP
jgi:hypothetical protein